MQNRQLISEKYGKLLCKTTTLLIAPLWFHQLPKHNNNNNHKNANKIKKYQHRRPHTQKTIFSRKHLESFASELLLRSRFWRRRPPSEKAATKPYIYIYIYRVWLLLVPDNTDITQTSSSLRYLALLYVYVCTICIQYAALQNMLAGPQLSTPEHCALGRNNTRVAARGGCLQTRRTYMRGSLTNFRTQLAVVSAWDSLFFYLGFLDVAFWIQRRTISRTPLANPTHLCTFSACQQLVSRMYFLF